MTAWLTPDDELVIELWPDAPPDSAATLLAAAQEECETFLGHPFGTDETIPARCKIALVMHARAIHRSLISGGGDQIGADGLTVTAYPMDRQVKARLRPPRLARRLA